MTTVTWDPLQETFIEQKASKLHNDAAYMLLLRPSSATVREDLAVNVSPSTHNITITMQLPHVAPSDVAVTIARRTLTVTAEQHQRIDQPGQWPLRSAFTWSMLLPHDIDSRHMKASLQHSVLRICLPRLTPTRVLTDILHHVGDHPRLREDIERLL